MRKMTSESSLVRKGWSGGLLGLALLLAACGGSGAASASQPASAASASAPAAAASSASAAASALTTVPELAGYKGADRQKVLEAGAHKEKSLTWYTSLAGPVITSLTKGFEQKYPYLHVQVFRAAEDQLVTRATQEAQAGKQVFDVLEAPPLAGLLLDQAKLLAPFYSPGLAAVPTGLQRAPSGGMAQGATVRISFIGFGYNTKLIPPSAAPKKEADLLNPALSGKIELAGSSTGYRWVGSVLHGMGQAPGEKFLTQLASQQKVKVQQISGKALLDLVAKGEVGSSPTIFRDHAQEAAAKKAPVKWVGLNPVVANVGQASLAAKAPHPHAALLFIDYLLGPGQKILKAKHYALPSDKAPFTYWVPEAGRTAKQAAQDLTGWSKIFKQTFR